MEATATTFEPGDRVICLDPDRKPGSSRLPGTILGRSREDGLWRIAMDCDREEKYQFYIHQDDLISEAVDA